MDLSNKFVATTLSARITQAKFSHHCLISQFLSSSKTFIVKLVTDIEAIIGSKCSRLHQFLSSLARYWRVHANTSASFSLRSARSIRAAWITVVLIVIIIIIIVAATKHSARTMLREDSSKPRFTKKL